MLLFIRDIVSGSHISLNDKLIVNVDKRTWNLGRTFEDCFESYSVEAQKATYEIAIQYSRRRVFEDFRPSGLLCQQHCNSQDKTNGGEVGLVAFEPLVPSSTYQVHLVDMAQHRRHDDYGSIVAVVTHYFHGFEKFTWKFIGILTPHLYIISFVLLCFLVLCLHDSTSCSIETVFLVSLPAQIKPGVEVREEKRSEHE